MTLCFNANQALFAARAGAFIISPFIGRVDDTGVEGMQLIREIVAIYRNDPGDQDHGAVGLDPPPAPYYRLARWPAPISPPARSRCSSRA